MNHFRLLVIAVLLSVLGISKTMAQEVKYQQGKDVNFEELLIQGQLKRAEVSVVTGNSKQGADGLLRLRENFMDRVAADAGESLEESHE